MDDLSSEEVSHTGRGIILRKNKKKHLIEFGTKFLYGRQSSAHENSSGEFNALHSLEY